MTVGESNDYLGYHKREGWGEFSTGREFNYPPWSPPGKHHFDSDYQYTVAALYITDAGRLLAELDGGTPNLLNSPGNLTLWIRNTAFPASSGAGSTIVFGDIDTSEMPDLDWKEDDTVRVVLSYERLLPSEPRNVSVTAPDGEVETLDVSWDEAGRTRAPFRSSATSSNSATRAVRPRKESSPIPALSAPERDAATARRPA